MESASKPGADLLWAFQLHREHQALAKRLSAVETTNAKQQERLAANENSVFAASAQNERIDALTEQVRKLEDSDVNEQMSGLASELRATRQQLEQVRNKVKAAETTTKEAGRKAEERDRGMQGRLEELDSAVARLGKTLHDFDARLRLAAEQGAQAARESAAVASERFAEQIGVLREKLSDLEETQNRSRALIESVQVSVLASRSEPVEVQTAPTSRHVRKKNGQSPNAPQALRDARTEQESVALDEPVLPRLDHVSATKSKKAALPTTHAAQKKPSGTSKCKKGFEKEIAGLITDDGSLTNVQALVKGQNLTAAKCGGKKRKAEGVEDTALESAFTQRATRSQAKKVVAKPAVTRKKAVASSAATVRKVAAMKTRRPPKAAVNKPTRPFFDESDVQVANSRTSSVTRDPPLASPIAASPLRLKPDKKLNKPNEHRPQQRRRRIEQEDSMEEFLAKCQAATEAVR